MNEASERMEKAKVKPRVSLAVDPSSASKNVMVLSLMREGSGWQKEEGHTSLQSLKSL